MKSLENEKILVEIVQIANRIKEKQGKCVGQYCITAPSELKKEIMEIMLVINQEVAIMDFMRVDTMNYFKEFSTRLDMEKIVEKVKEGVDKLKVNYYHDLAYIFRFYLYRLEPKILYNDNLSKKYNELTSYLYQENYIKSHKEYDKIQELITFIEVVKDSSASTIFLSKEVFKLKEILLQYEFYLELILEIEDINLKRAVLSYIDNEVKFYYINYRLNS